MSEAAATNSTAGSFGPISLQVALLIPILAGLIGLFNSFRMMRLPDPAPSGSTEGKALG